jgi:hypothetical protein
MAQEFYINKDSVNPVLRMEIVNDGRYSYRKFFDAVQDSDITFSMTNSATGIKKIVNAPAEIRLKEDQGCEEEYLICYQWKERDTKIPGIYRGQFNIKFNGDIKQGDIVYPIGNLVMPIAEPLTIYVI